MVIYLFFISRFQGITVNCWEYTHLDGSNFIELLEMILLTITFLDLDMALDEPMHPTPRDASSVDEKTYYNKWVKPNKGMLEIILNSISISIRGSTEVIENATDLLEAVKGQLEITDKAL